MKLLSSVFFSECSCPITHVPLGNATVALENKSSVVAGIVGDEPCRTTCSLHSAYTIETCHVLSSDTSPDIIEIGGVTLWNLDRVLVANQIPSRVSEHDE